MAENIKGAERETRPATPGPYWRVSRLRLRLLPSAFFLFFFVRLGPAPRAQFFAPHYLRPAQYEIFVGTLFGLGMKNYTRSIDFDEVELQGSQNIFSLEVFVICENLFNCHPRTEQLENQFYRVT
jgi:hypothetical protein